MFTIKTIPFGKTTEIKLINIHTGEYVAILPDFGCAINSLILKKGDKLFDLIEGSESYDHLLLNGLSEYKGSFLFPFPNRLKGGKYSFDGKNYEFENNDSDGKPNALHGILNDCKFNMVRFEDFYTKAEIDFSYTSSGIDSQYPFLYQVIIRYTLDVNNGLSIQTFVTNKGNVSMPVGLGWHPYFKTSGKIDEMMIHFPNSEHIELDNFGIPTMKITPSKLFKLTDSVNDTLLDDSFRVVENNPISEIFLFDSDNNVKVSIWQENGKNKFNFFQTYIPPHRKTIAIEPMTCAPDSFNNGLGLIKLSANEKFDCSWGIKLI